MPIETNLNVSPYFDDYSPDNDYYKILFRPGVALQARELTQLQSILQNQIEKFGDHIFKSGTIISGVNFRYNFKYNYVKILDLQVDGQPVVPSAYVGLYAKNSSNLVAQIVNYRAGFQSRDPDTNYLFLKYINAGTSGATSTFTADDVITIYSDAYKLYDFNVVNGGVGFSNSDTVQITSALIVANSTIGSGAGISQTIGANTANVYVIESNTTFGTLQVGSNTYTSSAGYTLLKIRPITADLSNSSVPASKWNITVGQNIVQGSNSALVVAKVGSGASATLTTDGSGIITDVSLVSSGSDYDILPHVTVRTASGTLTNLNITPFNYKAQVTVASSLYNAGGTTPVGNGYAFSVTEGIIFHKGHFVRVSPQTIVVNAYTSNVNGVTVGFETTETIVNSSVDSSLLDLATGTPNYSAPGANRLKLTPTLKVVNTDSVGSNNTFLPLVEFKDGEPSREFNYTQYNEIGKEMQRRTRETAGNFVIDKFVLSTKDKSTTNNNYVDLVVDPGLAYVSGVRVGSRQNTTLPLRRGVDTKITDARTISLNYGNYILVEELAGSFDFKTGDQIDLYPAPKNYISGATSPGSAIGTARVRSVVLDSGIPGTPTARYRVYLFDIVMNPGKSFKAVQSIYSSSPEAYADLVLETNPQTQESEAVLKDNAFNTLVFTTGINAVKSANSINYQYRTTATANVSTSGVATVTVSGSDIISYGSSVTLNSVQLRDIIVVPTTTMVGSVDYTSVSVTSGSATVTGTNIGTVFDDGDHIQIVNGSNTFNYRVESVVNVNTLTLSGNYSNTTNSSATVRRVFPALLPISTSSTLAANTNGDGTTLTINLGTGITASTENKITFNVSRQGATPVTKNVKRNLYVKLSMANNVASNNGPWSLGIPDGFRLNNVYVAGSSVVNTNSTNVTRYFFLDNGQKDSHYDHSKLVKIYNSDYALSTSDWLLVDFDAFTTSSEGFFTIGSYTIAANNSNAAGLGNTAINIVEVPEFINSYGRYSDLRDVIDFRPRISNTAVLTSTIASATVNPETTATFNTNDKLFPVPDSTFSAVYEHYLPRIDLVTIDTKGDFNILEGTSSDVNANVPTLPPDTMALGIVAVPPYPSLPRVPSSNTVSLISKSVGTTKPVNTRARNYTIGERELRSSGLQQQVSRYTMSDISRLERRLENLEYYTSLNSLEQKTKDLLIPSGIDGTNRFKNGFFVEQFNDYNRGDTTDPEFNCYIDQVNTRLYPPSSTYNIQARLDYTDSNVQADIVGDGSLTEPGLDVMYENAIMLPFTEEVVVKQDKFTSAIGSDGTNIKFIGNMSITPNSFKVLLKAEVKITDGFAKTTDSSTGGRSSAV